MKSLDLLDAIGDAKETYLLEAARAWEAPASPRKSPTLRKVLFLAAVIALLTCLLGCAIVMLRLQDQKIGEGNYTRYFDESGQMIQPTEVTMSVVAVRGVKDSPNYLATMEWYEFDKNYPSILEFDFVDQSLENYEVYEWIYGCYSQEMADKVDEIAAKYDLKLLSHPMTVQRWQTEILFDSLGIDGVCREEKTSRLTDGSGSFYEGGNFSYDFEFKLPQEEAWQNWIWATVCYSRKDYFHPIAATVDMDSLEQWNYTTDDGVDILIAQNKGGAILVAETEAGFFWVNLDTSTTSDASQIPTKQDIERMADAIDFTIVPQAPQDFDAIQKQLDESNAAYEAAQQAKITTYTDYASYLKDTYRNLYPADVYYALYDINNDGVEDFLFADKDCTFSAVKTIVDGVVKDLYNGENWYLCQDNIFVAQDRYSFRTAYYVSKLGAFDVNGNHVQTLEMVENDRREDFWTDKDGNQITAEEAEAILAKYTRQDIPVQPLLEYPVEEDGTTLEEYILSNTVTTTRAQRMAIYSEKVRQNQETAYVPATHYILMDINGDDIEDLLLSDNADTISDAFTVKNGELDTLFFWSSRYLCENNVLAVSNSSYQHEWYSYSSVDGEGWHNLDTLAYDKEGGKWYHDADGDNYYELEITEAEYNEIIASYRRVPLNWLPIADFSNP